MNVQVAEEEEDRCDQAEDKKPPTEEVTVKADKKIKTDIKPVQECEEPSPPCEFSWYATQWSQCSSKCAGMMGLQTRLEDDGGDYKVKDIVEDDDVGGGGGGSSGCCNLSSRFLTGLCFAEQLMTTGL